MKKTVILFFATLWFLQAFSQTGTTLTGQSFTINAPVTDGTTYKASEFVNFVPGASFQATADKELHALIDPYMIFPPTTGLTGGPNPGDDGVVGTIEGQGSVGPMGNFIYTIPLKLPECIPGMTPSLSLVYNSAGGDGYLGHGWSLGGLSSISRVPSNLYYDGVVDPVDFDDSDRLALDGSRLFVTSGNYWGTDAEYRFEAENGMKVVPNGGGFKVYSPDGKVSYYGSSETSKIWKPNGPAVQWFLDKVVDVFGNTIKIEYYHSSAGGEFSVVPHKIFYNYNSIVANFSTAVYNVEFVYKTESPFVRYSNQTAYLYDRVIEAIVIKKGDTEVYHYDLFYGYPMEVGMTTIESIRCSAPGNEYSFNPTKLLYSNNSEILLTTQQTSGMSFSSSGNGGYTADYLPGDFNGDGYTDFVRAKWYYDPVQTNAKVISGWDLFINDKNGGFTLRNQPQNSNNIVSQSGWDIFGGARIFSANINGDNKTDLVVFFDYDNKDFITADWDDYDAINKVQFLIADPLEPEFQPSAVIDLPGNIQQRLIEFIFADYNGDGIDDIFFNSQDLWDHNDGPRNWQYCFLTELNNNDIGLNQICAMIGSDFNLFEDFRPINFNGDNRAELSCRDMQDTEAPMILTLNGAGSSFLNIHTGHSRWKYEYYGDYNGDGLSDLLHFIPEPEWNSQTGRWLICYGTGSTYTYPEQEVFFGINVKPGGQLSNNAGVYLSDIVYLVGDFNGDGMDDVMESYYDRRQPTNSEYVRKVYFSQKGFAAPQIVKDYSSSWQEQIYAWPSSYATDVNGDNKEDLVSILLGELHFYYFGAGEPEGLMKEVENGFGVKEQITYSPGKSSAVYSNQLLNLYEDTKSNVFCSSMPMYVTQKRKTLSGTSLLNEEVYRYFSGMFHRKGKGFLGFDMVRTENTVNNLRTIINTKLFTDNTATYSFVLPETDYQVSYLVQEGNYLSRTQMENEYFVYPDKRYRVTESRSLTKTRDPLGGFFTGTSRVHKSFDALGQLINQVEYRSANNYEFSTPESNFEHRSVVNTSYLPMENNLLNRPDLVIATSYYKQPGSSSFMSKVVQTDYDYYQNGQTGYPLLKEVVQYASDPGDQMAVKKAFEYSALGLIAKETTSAPNYNPPAGTLAPASRISLTQYFADKPYLVESKRDPKNFPVYYSYDPLELYVSSTTDINGLQTTSVNDILGIQSSTAMPEGTTKVSCKRWAKVGGVEHDDNPPEGLYYVWTKTSGTSEALTFFNRMGQELRTVSYDAKGKKMYSDKTYDSRGRLHTQTNAYYYTLSSLSDITTTYTYDALDRVVATTTSRGATSVTYEGLVTKYTDMFSRQTVQTKNVAGWLTQSQDASGSSVNFQHDSDGNVVKTYHSGQPQETSIVNEYDSHGNCTKLIDPAAGTIDFKFDAFDQMVSRDDSRQDVATTYQYDILGRMTKRIEPEGTTNWIYDNKPSGNGLLGSVSYPGHSTEYTFDEYARVSQITNQINGVNYTQSVAYDPFSRVKRKETPDGLTIFTEYAPNGEVAKLYKGGYDPCLLWAVNATDNYGRLTKALHGNGVIAESVFENDRGLLTAQIVKKGVDVELFKRLYEWDNVGNLTWRKKIAGSTTLHESFTYDNLDRLDVTYLNGVVSGNTDYNLLGNVMGKSNSLGFIFEDAQYDCGTRNPYALISADANPAQWPQAPQTIAYNSYNKMTSIAEAPYHLAISYGYDHQRTYQELTQSDVVVTKKTFVGNGLEIIEKPAAGTIQKIHYLTGGDGLLFAMYVIDQNNQGEMYYIYTDHLGSPNLITDSECNVVQELSFDAWGNRRDPATWQPYTSLASIPSPLIDRGFTFHEHLYPFTLINMNGRAYDPLVGRFLSADPYIQAPDNPQNLNRYSYCLNNPLRYTDPSGEFVWTPIIIGAMIGAFSNATVQCLAGNVNSIGDFFGSAAIGALAGAVGGWTGSGVSATLRTATTLNEAVSNGIIVGSSSGFAGGFVGGAGYAWMGGANFEQGFQAGLLGGCYGAFSGALIGGISGKIQYQRQISVFQKGCVELGVNGEDPVPATDRFLSDAQKAWYKDAPMSNVRTLTVENVPESHLTGRYGLVTNNAPAKTVPLSVDKVLTGNSNVYFNKDLAFSSAKQLFFSMGHEFVHVSQFAALAGQSSSLLLQPGFIDLLEFHAYSYQHSLGGSTLNGFTRDVVKGFATQYPTFFKTLNYSNFGWTSSASFVYPF